jgi:hypothetical protein
MPKNEGGKFNLNCTATHSKAEIKIGATVRLKAQSGEIITGQVVHLWEDKSVPMVRVASGDQVYNVPVSMLVDEKN